MNENDNRKTIMIVNNTPQMVLLKSLTIVTYPDKTEVIPVGIYRLTNDMLENSETRFDTAFFEKLKNNATFRDLYRHTSADTFPQTIDELKGQSVFLRRLFGFLFYYYYCEANLIEPFFCEIENGITNEEQEAFATLALRITTGN
jgi:hypothetical protein